MSLAKTIVHFREQEMRLKSYIKVRSGRTLMPEQNMDFIVKATVS